MTTAATTCPDCAATCLNTVVDPTQRAVPRRGFRMRVIHCFWTFESIDDAADFLEAAFGRAGREVAASMKRPRLSYNVAVYHRGLGTDASGRQARPGDDQVVSKRFNAADLAGARDPRDRVIGSLAFAAMRSRSVTRRRSHCSPRAAVALGIVFGALALYLLQRPGAAGVGARARGRSASAIGGGIAAIIGFGCIAGVDHFPRRAAAGLNDPAPSEGHRNPSARLRRSRAPIV